jgi:altronate hydrolase
MSGNRVEFINIQETGGTLVSIECGKAYAMEMVEQAIHMQATDISFSDVIIGVECGGSDATSGISANPAAGWAVDRLIEQGSTVIFSELPELLGCNDYLLERITSDAMRAQLLDGLKRANELGNILNAFAISTGNEKGGLTTIEEKSLGALCKAGTKAIEGILKTGQKPEGPGLYLLDKVGMLDSQLLTHYEENDNDGLVSLIASGAHMILFTTGRGSVVGSVVSPVIKICGNPATGRRMADNFDIMAGSIIEGNETIEDVGRRIIDKIVEIASGKQTQAELLGHKEYHIPYKPGRACDVV